MHSPAPLPADEAERLSKLRSFAILDTDSDPKFDRIAEMARRQFDAPIALVSLVDESRQWFKARCGLSATETDRDVAFCAHAILQDSVFCVLDALADPRFSENPLVTGEPHIRFYAGAPLKTQDGYSLGTLCVLDTQSRDSFSEDDQRLLSDLAAIVIDHIEIRTLAAQVVDDVQPHIEAKSELEELQHRLSLFFDHAPASIAMLDINLRYISATRQWLELYGLSGRAILGESHEALVPTLPKEWREQYRRCLSGEALEIEEDLLSLPSGEQRWIQRSVRPWFGTDGAICGLILLNQTIDHWKTLNEELETQSTFLKAVLESIQDGIVACDAQGRLSLFNEASKRFHGVDSAPIPPEKWSEFYDLYESDGSTVLSTERVPLFRALQGDQVEAQEMVIAADGQEPRYIIANACAMYDRLGVKIGAVASMHDVTAAREARAQWLAAESRYQAIFHNTYQFCGLLDTDGRLIEVNDTAVDFSGVSRGDLVGKLFWDCHWWLVSSEVREQLKAAVARAAYGEFVRYEVEVNGAHGERVPIDFSLKPVFNDEGHIDRLIAEGRDISDKRGTEALLRLVADNLPFLVTYVDGSGIVRFINRTGAHWCARSSEQVIGTAWAGMLAFDDGADGTVTSAQDGTIRQWDVSTDCVDGVTRFLQVTTVPYSESGGSVSGHIVIAVDISDKQRAEEELRKQRHELELIFNNVPIRIFLKDDKNRVLRLNEPAATSMGMSVAEVEGGDTYELFPEMAAAYHTDDLEVLNQGKPKLGIEEFYTPKEGKHGWSRTDKVPYIDRVTGERYLFIASFDITDQKNSERALRDSEAQYRDLYNKTPVMQQSFDAELKLLSVSDFWLHRLGYQREEVVGTSVLNYMLPGAAAVAENELFVVLMRDGVLNDVETQMQTSSGDCVDVLVSAIVETDAIDGTSHALAVLTDVTDRKNVERQLLRAQKMESVGQLTGGLAHDFNNILGVVMGNLQLVQRGVADDPKALQRIEAALDATQRGAELNKRLLAFSRRQHLEAEVIAPAPLIAGISEMLARVLGEQIELKCHLKDSLPSVCVDPSQLESAILNLAVNARDAMVEGGSLTIETEVKLLPAHEADRLGDLTAGEYLVIAVSDTGSGMDAETIEQAFEPFFTTKNFGKGSGLGLSMVYGFMKQSDGVVRIYSEVGRGTTVRLYLPIHEGVECPEEDQDGGSEGSVGGSETILVVEDQDDVREMAVGVLEDLGYRVVQAASGQDALEVLEASSDIDLIFTDIVMPGGMDGARLAERAKAIRPELPILYTSGYAEAAVLSRGDISSAHNLVTKPYLVDELARKVRRSLDDA